MQIKNILIAGLIIINIWHLIVVLAYSAAHSMTHLHSYVAVSKRLLNNCKSIFGYLFQLIITVLTVPAMILLIMCEGIALFIETFNLVRKNPRSVKGRRKY